MKVMLRKVAVLAVLSACIASAACAELDRGLGRFVIELPSECSTRCERLVKKCARDAGCERAGLRHLMGRIRRSRAHRFVNALIGRDNGGSRFLELRCPEEGKVATAQVLSEYLTKAGVKVTAVEEDVMYAAVGAVVTTHSEHDRVHEHEPKQKYTPPQWNVDEADSEVDGKRCASSKLGAGATVLVMDSGCTPMNNDYCESFVDGKRVQGECEDMNGHGTHVAGTVAHPMWGVAPACSVGCSRVLGARGTGSTSGIIEAIVDAVEYAKTLSGPLIINMSLAGRKSIIMNHAVRYAARRGVYFAIAAGNSNIDARLVSPASAASRRQKRIFVVGAHARNGTAASFTNFGPKVTISAGGVRIKSLALDGSARTDSGTSMASPAVAGAMCALQSDGKQISHYTLTTGETSVSYTDGADVDTLSYDCD